MLKDLDLALADAHRGKLPLTQLTRKLVEEASLLGSQRDLAAIAEVFARP